MINIYIKSLCGDIQVLEFSDETKVTLSLIKPLLNKKGYITNLFLNPNEDEKDEKKNFESDSFPIEDGAILYLFYEKEQFTKEETDIFEHKLKNKLRFFQEFKEAIIRHKAIIAGGSVLSTFARYDINDLDIYIHYSESKEFLYFLYTNGGSFVSNHIAPAYDESFFRKNNIMGRFHMSFNSSFYGFRNQQNHLYNQFFIKMDIMIIPDHIPLENVVTNFDLTFCQVWWDGNSILSNDIEDVRSRSGSLNKDYIQAYLDMNTFIIKRIQKYKKRGFKIKINFEITETTVEKQKKKITSNEHWAISKIIEFGIEIMKPRYNEINNPQITRQELTLLNNNSLNSINSFFYIYPNEMTRHSLEEKIGKEMFNMLVLGYSENTYLNFLPRKYTQIFESLFADILPDRDNDEVDYSHYLIFFAQKRREIYNEKRDRYIELSNMRDERKRYFISLIEK
jgi:hypothetical protein